MAAPFRYARILNGLSFLIPRRSAIARRMWAIARLSNSQAFDLDSVVEESRAAGRERLGDRGSCREWTVAEETPTAARAADFRGSRAGCTRARDEILNGRRRHARREPLAVLPLGGDLPADFAPVTALQRRTHGDPDVADALEAIEGVAVALDVGLGGLPVIGAGGARRARGSEHELPPEPARGHGRGDPLGAVPPPPPCRAGALQ